MRIQNWTNGTTCGLDEAWNVPRDRAEHVRDRTGAFMEAACAAQSISELRLLLSRAAAELGFSYFALADHVNANEDFAEAIRIHNYPDRLERYHNQQCLGRNDPVHRACQRTAVGFAWHELPKMIQLTPQDLRVLQAAANAGIGDGFTVPVHLPGEFSGSCSFAARSGVSLEYDSFAAAQLIGTFGFEAARRLTRRSDQKHSGPIHLSDRERECLIWIARGKSDSEIATILGISSHTVHQYVKHARAIVDAVSRSQLIARALFAGTISFLDVVGR